FLKILPVFIFVLPGIIAAALYSDIRGGSADAAYPALVTRLLPAGFKGLVLAGMLAALMSSLASAFNSCSTLLTWDVYRKLRPDASEQRLVAVGRITTVLLVGLDLPRGRSGDRAALTGPDRWCDVRCTGDHGGPGARGPT